MKQVSFIRGKVLQQLKALRVFISCLPESEFEAMQRLSGTEGVKTAARIADLILQELGHPMPKDAGDGTRPTLRIARKVMDDGVRG